MTNHSGMAITGTMSGMSSSEVDSVDWDAVWGAWRQHGGNAMATGGAIAVLGLADGPIPDGEIIGAATYIAGFAIWTVGHIGGAFS